MQRRAEQMVASEQQFGADTAKDAKQEFGAVGYGPAAPKQAGPVGADKKTSGAKMGCIIAAVAALVLLLGGLLFIGCCKKSGAFEVTGHSWERTIEIEEYRNVRESKWCDELPPGARELSRSKEQRSTEKVEDGKECRKIRKDQGNGSFKEVEECKPKYREKPVMADKCSFEAPLWRANRTVKESGASNKDALKWPMVPALRTGTCIGCEREGKRTETLTIRFKNLKDGTAATCTTNDQKWKSVAVGSKYEAKYSVTDSVDCDSLKAK